ncbi:hypothetical protein M427DRAFT_62998 [Gonapodya prolifera JEL478]|uniref:SH3 domain-containing protein n=1 Tax=Gonapodya prolifera (strain JEL478) TaxID=1344416 RepID=A0A138ZZY3_GONPJ|nr:hypothetical protein M427DRAFT_62998 [Gonapodya prolifera JEL478]|eukprot:KXS10059.1 hypothetical protein M427DRAFT_62998 [Gonapodya prolifera JEL478]
MASEGANGRLIDALENADLEEVRRALRQGANANEARKRVTLLVRLPDGTTRSDSQLMEPPLALAIRTGRADLVKALIDSGCDPNVKIEWSIGGWHSPWTQLRWDSQRWDEDDALKFASALDFALTRGRRLFNFPGREVTLRSPSDGDAVCVWISLQPQIEVIRVLLEGGARVTPTALVRAKGLKNPQLLELVHDFASKEPVISPVATSPTTVSPLKGSYPQLELPPSRDAQQRSGGPLHQRQPSKGRSAIRLSPTAPDVVEQESAPSLSDSPSVGLAAPAAEVPMADVTTSPPLAPSPLPSDAGEIADLLATVADLRAVLAERDARISELEQDLDVTVDDLQQVLADGDSEPTQRDRERRKRLVELENGIRERDERLAQAEAELVELREKEERVQELEEMVREREEKIATMEEERTRLEDGSLLSGTSSTELLNSGEMPALSLHEVTPIDEDTLKTVDPAIIINFLLTGIRERDVNITLLVETDHRRRATIAALRGQLLSLEEAQRNAEASHARTLADRTERITTLGNELGAAQRQAQEARGQVRSREDRIAKLMNQIAMLEEDVLGRTIGDENEAAAYAESLRAQVRERDDRIADLEEEMYKGYRQTAEEIRQLKENTRKADKLQQSTKDELASVLEAESSLLQKQLSEERDQNKDLKEQVRYLESELAVEKSRAGDMALLREPFPRGLTPDLSSNVTRHLETELASEREKVDRLLRELKSLERKHAEVEAGQTGAAPINPQSGWLEWGTKRHVLAKDQSAAATVNGQSQVNGTRQMRTVAPTPPSLVKRTLIVVASYEPKAKDELTLKIGDIVVCLFEWGDGWGAGTNKSRIQTGFFPLSCVSLESQSVSEVVPVIPTRTLSLRDRRATLNA